MPYLTLLATILFSGWLSAQSVAPDFELDHRIQLSVDRLTDREVHPAFTHDFLLADVRLNPKDPRRFFNFSGDLSGRYIEVMSLLSPEQRREVRLADLVSAVIAEQGPDGRFGDPELRYTADEIGGEHMALLWGNGRLLVGLMTYYEQSGDKAALSAARRLGEFFIATAESCRQPAIRERLEGFGAKGIICFTQYIEGLVLLARATGEERFTQASVDAYTILPGRGVQHAHGYLSTLRGVLMLHELTKDRDQLKYVRQTVDDLLASDDHTIYGATFEYFGGKSDQGKENRDEGCSSADFVRLLLHLHRLTGEVAYLEAGEAGIYNALYYNQYANGDFGHHYFVDHGVLPANPRRSWWCCTMHGLRGLLAIKQAYTLVDEKSGVSLQLPLSQRYSAGGRVFTLRGLPTSEDGREAFELRILEWDGSPLTLRLPHWAENWTATAGETQGDRLVLRKPEPGRTIRLSADFRLRLRTNDGKITDFPDQPASGYLTYGPYIMGSNQDEFVAEPDWANQVLLPELEPTADAPYTLVSRFRHAGYPGLQPVRFVPFAHQLYFGHPYMRIKTLFTTEIRPQPADR